MKTIRKTISTVALMATVLAGTALMSGWMTIAIAGGDNFGG